MTTCSAHDTHRRFELVLCKARVEKEKFAPGETGRIMIRRRTVFDSCRLVAYVLVLSISLLPLQLKLQVHSFIAISTAPSPRYTTTGITISNKKETSDESSDDTAMVTATVNTGTPITPIGKMIQQRVIIDGPEWQSVQNQLIRFQSSTSLQQQPQNSPSYMTSTCGKYNVVTGSVNGARMVGMQHLLPSTTTTTDSIVTLDQDRSIQLYKESIAAIPNGVTEMEAMWTMIQSFSTIHCVRPILQNIGGSNGTIDFVPSSNGSRVVIVGNNPLAIQTASILHEVFQYNVTVVASTPITTVPTLTKNKVTMKSGRSVQFLQPATETTADENDGKDEPALLGFATVVDQFDVLIDTIGNELSNSVIQENLKANHNCHIYLSTISESQRIILQNGLLFGPNQSKEHLQKLTTSVNSNINNGRKNGPAYFPTPFGLGTTVETILQNGIVLKPQQPVNNVFVRTWSLKDFWEYTTWPRDATTSNSRFGFPSDVSDSNRKYYGSELDNDDDDDPSTTMISAPPLRANPGRDMFRTRPENFEIDDDDDDDQNAGLGSVGRTTGSNDRYVMDVSSVNDLKLIVQNEMTCIVFVSAPFCRTCRYLKPQFVRMAREHCTKTNNGNNNKVLGSNQHLNDVNDSAALLDSTVEGQTKDAFMFIKAEASGQTGKDIGRALGIDTVPTFILYKNGRRYGTPITSVTRLPSKDLDDTILAIQENRTVDFSSLFPFDNSSIDDDSSDRTKRNRSKLS